MMKSFTILLSLGLCVAGMNPLEKVAETFPKVQTALKTRFEVAQKQALKDQFKVGLKKHMEHIAEEREHKQITESLAGRTEQKSKDLKTNNLKEYEDFTTYLQNVGLMTRHLKVPVLNERGHKVMNSHDFHWTYDSLFSELVVAGDSTKQSKNRIKFEEAKGVFWSGDNLNSPTIQEHFKFDDNLRSEITKIFGLVTGWIVLVAVMILSMPDQAKNKKTEMASTRRNKIYFWLLPFSFFIAVLGGVIMPNANTKVAEQGLPSRMDFLLTFEKGLDMGSDQGALKLAGMDFTEGITIPYFDYKIIEHPVKAMWAVYLGLLVVVWGFLFIISYRNMSHHINVGNFFPSWSHCFRYVFWLLVMCGVDALWKFVSGQNTVMINNLLGSFDEDDDKNDLFDKTDLSKERSKIIAMWSLTIQIGMTIGALCAPLVLKEKEEEATQNKTPAQNGLSWWAQNKYIIVFCLYFFFIDGSIDTFMKSGLAEMQATLIGKCDDINEDDECEKYGLSDNCTQEEIKAQCKLDAPKLVNSAISDGGKAGLLVVIYKIPFYWWAVVEKQKVGQESKMIQGGVIAQNYLRITFFAVAYGASKIFSNKQELDSSMFLIMIKFTAFAMSATGVAFFTTNSVITGYANGDKFRLNKIQSWTKAGTYLGKASASVAVVFAAFSGGNFGTALKWICSGGWLASIVAHYFGVKNELLKGKKVDCSSKYSYELVAGNCDWTQTKGPGGWNKLKMVGEWVGTLMQKPSFSLDTQEKNEQNQKEVSTKKQPILMLKNEAAFEEYGNTHDFSPVVEESDSGESANSMEAKYDFDIHDEAMGELLNN